jgi:hypothetical protein
VDFGAPAPATFEPPLPPPTANALAAGWSRDGEDFGWCAVSARGCTFCEFMDSTGAGEEVSDCDPGSDTPVPERNAAIHTRIAQRGYGTTTGPWVFAEHLELLWNARTGDPATMQPAELRIGARVRGSQVPVFTMVLRQPDYTAIEPLFVGPSPDGKLMGAIARSAAPEGADDGFKIQVLPVHEMANKAFNGAAMFAHRAGDHDTAIDLYHRATAVQPRDPHAMFNFACALAQVGAPATRAALEGAIERGGEPFRRRLPDEEALAALRGEAWFDALVSGAGDGAAGAP